MKGNESPYQVKVGGLGVTRIMPGGDLGLNRVYQFRKTPFHLTWNYLVAKPVSLGYWLFSRMLSSRCHCGVSLRAMTRQEDLVHYPQCMRGLSDLPACNASAFPQVSEKSVNILSGPVFQRFLRQRIGKVFRPVPIKWRTIRPYPVLLCASPVGLPKTIGLFGIAEIHDFHEGTAFYFNRLDKNQACNDR
jgi:hypothetical protein